jgi:murein L,D-transpeptidase YcbB/YkuD
MNRIPHRLTCIALCALTCLTANADDFSAAAQSLLAADRHPYLRAARLDRERDTLQRAYAANQLQPLWVRNGEMTRQGVMMLQSLRNAGEFGLRAEDYEGTQLIYHAIDLITDPSAPPSRWAELDVGISLAAARMIRHLHFGRVDPRLAGFDLNKSRAAFDAARVLQTLATGDDIDSDLAQAEPPFLHYRLLKIALRYYRVLAVDDSLTALPTFKARSIKPGEPYDGVPALRRLLVALGDLNKDAATSDAILDETLTEALKRFQQRHGLTADGALGRTTFAALTTPLSSRVKQLEYALERWRWLPEFASPPIIVNIPQFRLFAFRTLGDRAADILQMDVIVGQTYPKYQTPVFSGEMKYLVFRPFWDVPSSILDEEMLPEIRANPAYFEQHNLEIVSGSDPNAPAIPSSPDAIEALTAGKLRLRQKPGDNNSLGLMKFMLPNSYNVYLHSTPAQKLFGESRRAFSHGCIRVADPVALAEHVLHNETDRDGQPWTRDKIVAALQSDDNRHVFLSKPIPVFIVYSSAMALEDGAVLFFDDIYGHDAKLKKLLR